MGREHNLRPLREPPDHQRPGVRDPHHGTKSYVCTPGEVHPSADAAWSRAVPLGIHPAVGWMHARIPFHIQIAMNGREWLSRQMDQAGLQHLKQGNAFVWIEDYARAQALLVARETCPAMLTITSSPAPDSASSVTSVWRSSCHRLASPALTSAAVRLCTENRCSEMPPHFPLGRYHQRHEFRRTGCSDCPNCERPRRSQAAARTLRKRTPGCRQIPAYSLRGSSLAWLTRREHPRSTEADR